jgi:hypothetical protein
VPPTTTSIAAKIWRRSWPSERYPPASRHLSIGDPHPTGAAVFHDRFRHFAMLPAEIKPLSQPRGGTAKTMSQDISVPDNEGLPSVSRTSFHDISGSHNVPFGTDLVRRTLACVYSTASDQQEAVVAIGAALKALEPKDEIEGMLAAQILAAHHACIHCFERARDPAQPAEYAARYRRDSANLSRSVIDLLDGLARKRGHVSRQIVRVERVIVEQGAQAMVGAVSGGGSK